MSVDELGSAALEQLELLASYLLWHAVLARQINQIAPECVKVVLADLRAAHGRIRHRGTEIGHGRRNIHDRSLPVPLDQLHRGVPIQAGHDNGHPTTPRW